MAPFISKEEMYALCPKGAVMVEVGVWRGENAARMLLANPSRLFLVDIWHWQADPTNDMLTGTDDAKIRQVYRDVVEKFFKDDRVVVMKIPSLEAAKVFADGTFDLVYIDACHMFNEVMADLRAWLPKVKTGGLLCGHDWDYHSGVRMAAEQFIADEKAVALESVAKDGRNPQSFVLRVHR